MVRFNVLGLLMAAFTLSASAADIVRGGGITEEPRLGTPRPPGKCPGPDTVSDVSDMSSDISSDISDPMDLVSDLADIVRGGGKTKLTAEDPESGMCEVTNEGRE